MYKSKVGLKKVWKCVFKQLVYVSNLYNLLFLTIIYNLKLSDW